MGVGVVLCSGLGEDVWPAVPTGAQIPVLVVPVGAQCSYATPVGAATDPIRGGREISFYLFSLSVLRN